MPSIQVNPGPSIQGSANLEGNVLAAWNNSAGTGFIGPSGSVVPLGSVGLTLAGNSTAQSSSSSGSSSGLIISAAGIISAGFSSNSLVISAGVPVSRMIWPCGNFTAVSAFGNATASIQYVPVDWPLTATRLDALVMWSGATSATTNTGAIGLSVYCGVSTRNGSTLSSLSSGSTQTTYSYASNTAGLTDLSAGYLKPISCPININMTPGEYYVGFNVVTTASSVGLSTTALGQTISMYGGNQIATASNYAEIGSNTATNVNLYSGMGLFSVATTGMPASLAFTDINQTGANLSRANIALNFRNY